MLRRIAVLFFVLMIFMTACKRKSVVVNAARKAGRVLAEGFVVEPRTESENVEVPGSLLPVEETQIRPEVTGRIVLLNFQEGSMVYKGSLLVKLFDQDLQAQLKKLQVQLDISKRTVERQKDLLAINGISQQDFDLSALAVDNLN